MHTLCLEKDSFGSLWHTLLERLLIQPVVASPRGLKIREQLNVQLHLTNPYANIIFNKKRNISYRFMLAEWLWIYFGRDDVATISRYNPNIAQFSDNGIDFNGAYGKAIAPHWERIITTLTSDRDSRQAVLVIYRAPSGPTKDIPCTISLQWLIRNNYLHCIANMRSSDIWLGLPYDVFNFTMLTELLRYHLPNVAFGSFTINLGSSHLYESNIKLAEQAYMSHTRSFATHPLEAKIPPQLESSLMGILKDPSVLSFPWVDYHWALHAPTNKEAFMIIQDLIAKEV